MYFWYVLTHLMATSFRCSLKLANALACEFTGGSLFHTKFIQQINVSGIILICTLIQAFWDILFSIWDSSPSSPSPSSLTELARRFSLFISCGLTTASMAAIFASKAVLSSSRLCGKVKVMMTAGSCFWLLSSYLMVHLLKKLFFLLWLPLVRSLFN